MSAVRRRSDRGVVLLNALVIVAALASAATLLLARAETGRGLQHGAAEAAQLRLYLDAYEALALRALAAPGTPAADLSVPLDRGEVAGTLLPLQGRFNVNWLADPEDAWARETLERLAARLGVPAGDVAVLAAAVSREGAPPAAFARRDPPEAAPAGPVPMAEALAGLPGLSPAATRLSPYLAALPGHAGLDLNAASPELLRAALPAASDATLGRLRAAAPHGSVEAALMLLGPAAAELDPTRFAVAGTWFEARIAARLGDTGARRRTVFERRTLPRGPRVAYRLDELPRDRAPTDGDRAR